MSEFHFTYEEMAMLVDALAYMRKDENEMRRMGHSVAAVTELRAGIRRAMANWPCDSRNEEYTS